MTENNLIKFERINYLNFTFFPIGEIIDPIAIMENINLKSLNHIENIYLLNLNSEKFELILLSKGREDDGEIRKRPTFIINMNKERVEFLAPLKKKESNFKEIIEKLSAEADTINITLFRLDKEKKNIRIVIRMSFELSILDFEKVKTILKRVNEGCKEIQDSNLYINGISLLYKDNHTNYTVEVEEMKKDKEKSPDIMIYIEETREELTYGEISIEQFIKKHITNLNSIITNIIGG
ncbi:hypothetical protein LCGC14_1738670 [marine sediment metagenome]|uniref:Uncharacterized protein n=1 Tax=marine sediment metagenome TaxID=412755 RepID=A0A0F9K711_9ZZZZ